MIKFVHSPLGFREIRASTFIKFQRFNMANSGLVKTRLSTEGHSTWENKSKM